MTAQAKIPHVYQAIAEVQGELAKTGIAKNRTNLQPGANYSFRGIDDVYAALSPLLAKHKLVVIPRVTHRECVERKSAKGNPLFNVTVHAEFDFVSALDGTTHTAATFGEAMDSSDKATNKAMSAAYKYAAFMTFAIPTEGDNDADGTTHEIEGYVNDEQLGVLQGYASAGVIDAARFCAFFQIASLKHLPASRYDEAIRMAKAKQERAVKNGEAREQLEKSLEPAK